MGPQRLELILETKTGLLRFPIDVQVAAAPSVSTASRSPLLTTVPARATLLMSALGSPRVPRIVRKLGSLA